MEQFFSKLDKYSAIILDDLGYVKKTDGETHVLFELIAHRYKTADGVDRSALHPIGPG